MRAKRAFSALRGRLRGTAESDERLPTSTPVRLLHLLAALLGVGAVCALAWQMSGVHVQGGPVPPSSLPVVPLAAAAAASSTGNRSDGLLPRAYPQGAWVAPMSTAYGDGASPSTATFTNHNVDPRLDFVRAARKGDMAASNVATLSPPPSPPPPPPSPPPPTPPTPPTPPPTPPLPPFPPPEPPHDTPISRDIELDDEGRLLPYRLPEGANPRYRWVVVSKSKEVWSVADMAEVSRESEWQLDEQARIDQSMLDRWRLTRSLVRNLAQKNILLVTWANDNHFDFVQNWVWHLRGLNVTNFLVGAMDDVILHKLIEARVPTFNMKTGLDTKDLGWGTAAFHKMGRTKVSLIQSVLSLGVDVLVCDVDTVWLQDPTPFLLKYPHADVLTSSDHLANTIMGVSPKANFALESPTRAWSAFNIGIIFFRQHALPFVKHWNALVTKKPDYWDQNAFNDLLKAGYRGSGSHKPAANGLWKGYNNKLRAGILPVATFCSGHAYFVQRLPMRTHRKAYVVHATFQFSGSVGKRHRFREAQLWNDPVEYFDPPQGRGFLSYQPYIPDSLKKKPTTHNPSHLIELHFKLVNYQLSQLRSALALATTLDRILIMPKLWCLLDRWWAPHEGRIPGTSGPPPGPFVCPLDHVLNLERMAFNFSVAEFGPHVDWREYSFLSNPRLPQHVASSKVIVRVAACRPEPNTTTSATNIITPHSSSTSSSSIVAPQSLPQPKSPPCSLSPRREHPNEVVLPSRFTPVEAAHALAAHDARIMHFASLRSSTFRGLTDREAYHRFERRLKEYTSIWCCKRAHPGHIHYDLFWDVKNHTDKHNKLWTGPWVPRPGP